MKEVEEVELCPGNAPCPHHTTPVRFLKISCHHFLTSDLKYQHLRPPSPEFDYVPIRVELREKESRALLEVGEGKEDQEEDVEAKDEGRRTEVAGRGGGVGERRKPAGSKEASLLISRISLLISTGSIAT